MLFLFSKAKILGKEKGVTSVTPVPCDLPAILAGSQTRVCYFFAVAGCCTITGAVMAYG